MIDQAKELAEAEATIASLKSDIHAILGLLTGLRDDYHKRGEVVVGAGIDLVIQVMDTKLKK